MAQTYQAQHRREDDVQPSPILDLAILARRISGSTHTRAAKDGA